MCTGAQARVQVRGSRRRNPIYVARHIFPVSAVYLGCFSPPLPWTCFFPQDQNIKDETSPRWKPPSLFCLSHLLNYYLVDVAPVFACRGFVVAQERRHTTPPCSSSSTLSPTFWRTPTPKSGRSPPRYLSTDLQQCRNAEVSHQMVYNSPCAQPPCILITETRHLLRNSRYV